jgi:hypothetical protein
MALKMARLRNPFYTIPGASTVRLPGSLGGPVPPAAPLLPLGTRSPLFPHPSKHGICITFFPDLSALYFTNSYHFSMLSVVSWAQSFHFRDNFPFPLSLRYFRCCKGGLCGFRKFLLTGSISLQGDQFRPKRRNVAVSRGGNPMPPPPFLLSPNLSSSWPQRDAHATASGSIFSWRCPHLYSWKQCSSMVWKQWHRQAASRRGSPGDSDCITL